MAGKTLAQYAAEAQRQPFVLDPGDGRQVPLVIEPPTVGALMAIEEAGTAREALTILAGDQASPLLEAIKDLPAPALGALLDDMRAHFGLGN
jgi:hypothetical protein